MVYVNKKKYRGCVESAHERLNRIIQETDAELDVEEMIKQDGQLKETYDNYVRG